MWCWCSQENDPFEEDDDTEVLVGSVKVWLGSLAYNIDTRDQLDITDYRGDKASTAQCLHQRTKTITRTCLANSVVVV